MRLPSPYAPSRHNNRIAGFDPQILLGLTAIKNVLVAERVFRLNVVFVAHDKDFLSIREWGHSAPARNCLQDLHTRNDRIASYPSSFSRLVDALTIHLL